MVMYSTPLTAIAVWRRGSFGDSGLRASSVPPVILPVVLRAFAQLDGAGQNVDRALLGIAFAEQCFAGLRIANLWSS